MTQPPILTIGIINYNACEWLRPCLTSIFREVGDGGSMEVIVVDNASEDESVAMVRHEFPHARVLALTENRGYAAGCNEAARVGAAPFVLLLNPDVELREGCLSAMLGFAQGNPRAGIVGPRLLNSDGSHQPSCGMFPTLVGILQEAILLTRIAPRWGAVARRHGTALDPEVTQPVEVLLGAFLLCRREMLEALGGLDERFFMYSEEVDLCYRACRAGWETWYLPEATAIHHGGKSTEPVASAMFAELHRSKVRFLRFHRSPAAARVGRVLLALGAVVRGALWSAACVASAPFPSSRSRMARRAAPFWAAVAAHLRP